MISNARFESARRASLLSALTIGLSAFMTSAMAGSGATPLGPPITALANADNFDSPSRIASDAAGNFIVAAQCLSGTAPAVCAQRFQADGTLAGTPFQVVNDIGTDHAPFSLAMNGAGEFAVAWSSIPSDGVSYPAVHVQRFAADGSLKGEVFDPPATTSAQGSQVTALGLDANGDLAIVWVEGVGSNSFSKESLHAAVYSPSNALQGRARVVDSSFNFRTGKYGSAGTQLGPASLAMNDAGDFVVVWSKWNVDTGDGHLYGQRFAATGVPRGFRLAIEDFAGGGSVDGAGAGAGVAMDASGAFAVTWNSAIADGSGNIVFRQFNRNGVAAAPAQTVATYCNIYPGAGSDIAMDANGNFVVAWNGSDPGVSTCNNQSGEFNTSHVYAQRYDLGGQALGSPFVADDSSGQSVGAPRVAMASSGARFAIEWNQADQSSISVLTRAFSVP